MAGQNFDIQLKDFVRVKGEGGGFIEGLIWAKVMINWT